MAAYSRACSSSAPVLIDTIRKVLYTGKIGDGKIFVYDVANVEDKNRGRGRAGS